MVGVYYCWFCVRLDVKCDCLWVEVLSSVSGGKGEVVQGVGSERWWRSKQLMMLLYGCCFNSSFEVKW